MKKTLIGFVRRGEEDTHSRLLVEASILLATSRGNPSTVLKEAAAIYKVDTDAIAIKAKQDLGAKERAKKTAHAVSTKKKRAA